MKKPGRKNFIMPRAAMTAIAGAGIITATVAATQGYDQAAMEESSHEQPARGKPPGDVLKNAMQESEHERP